MVDIDVGNLYVTSGSVSGNTINGGTTIQIESVQIEYGWNNAISIIPIPVTSRNRTNASKAAYTRVVDLKRITESINVRGHLVDEPTESAITKRNNLLSLGNTCGELTLVWGQSPYQTIWKNNPSVRQYGAFIQKMNFTEKPGLVASEGTFTNPPPERQIEIQASFIRGRDI